MTTAGLSKVNELYIEGLPSKSVLATDASGKVIEGTPPDLSSKEDVGVAAGLIGTHEETYDHDLISTALQAETDPHSLHLNQTTPQTVTGGAPIFDGGIKSNDDIILKAGKKLIFDGE